MLKELNIQSDLACKEIGGHNKRRFAGFTGFVGHAYRPQRRLCRHGGKHDWCVQTHYRI